MRDFTLTAYSSLIDHLLHSNYHFITFEEYCSRSEMPQKWCILRHDVDRIPWNAVKMASIEQEKGIKSSYYFRVAKEAYNPDVIKEIVDLGHEAGYHYEDMDLVSGDIDAAYQSFKKNLEHFRAYYPVRTICMHGSPLSKYDNRDVWAKYDYKESGVIGEPYFDLDYQEVFYITDTGRSWKNGKSTVRDKVNSGFDLEIQSTQHLIKLIQTQKLPNKIMMNTHPNRWFDAFIPWTRELVFQNLKNVIKRFVIVSRSSGS